jgi:general secretion pathway protein M
MTLQQTLAQFWSARAPRERQFLAAGGIAVALALLYFVLIAPAASGIERLQRLLPQTRERAARLEALLAEAKGLRRLPHATAPGASDARAALEKSLDAAGLKAAHSEVLPNGDLHLNFAAVPFGKWTTWLASGERTMGVHTVAARIKAAAVPTPGASAGGHPAPAGPAPGSVDIDLTLHVQHAG